MRRRRSTARNQAGSSTRSRRVAVAARGVTAGAPAAPHGYEQRSRRCCLSTDAGAARLRSSGWRRLLLQGGRLECEASALTCTAKAAASARVPAVEPGSTPLCSVRQQRREPWSHGQRHIICGSRTWPVTNAPCAGRDREDRTHRSSIPAGPSRRGRLRRSRPLLDAVEAERRRRRHHPRLASVLVRRAVLRPAADASLIVPPSRSAPRRGAPRPR
jgi:hypothetical protein